MTAGLGANLVSFGDGLASDAVEDSMGVASDDDTTAGTDDDFESMTRRAASSAAGDAGVARGLLSFTVSDDCESGEELLDVFKGVLFHSVSLLGAGGGDLGGGIAGFWLAA